MGTRNRTGERGPAGFCRVNRIQPGEKIEILWPGGWIEVTLTAIGQRAILVRLYGSMEFAYMGSVYSGDGIRKIEGPKMEEERRTD